MRIENGEFMAGGTDLIGAFRAYAQKALGNDFNPEKAATALNSWIKESGDALKDRVERETERAVKKLGLAKESDLHKLREEIRALRQELGLKDSARSTKGKGSVAKKSSATKKKKSASASARKSSSRSNSSPAGRKKKSGGAK